MSAVATALPLVLPTAVPLVATVLAYRRDRRTLRTAVLLLVTLLTFLGALFGRLMGEAVAVLPANAAGWIALGLAAAALLTVLVLAGYLAANGIGMLRREGRRPSTALSLVLGLAMIGYAAVPVLAVLADQEDVMLAFLLTVPPVAFFSVLFVAFLLYMPVYAFAVRHDHHQPGAVIVLGARVVGNAPTPLLRSRLEAGIAAWSRARTHGPCLFVTSGGQGTDEVAPEGRVMAEYAAAHGVDTADVVVEDRSTNTEQNLRLSQALLAERGASGRILVATSDFHALRAAMLMRRLGMAGDAIGGRTAQYYRPTATIREFAAVLRDRRRTVLVLGGLSALPLLAASGITLISWLSALG